MCYGYDMKLGAYTLIRKIAEGGIAEIYLAKAASLRGSDKYLVCKCIKSALTGDSEFIDSIIREARLSVRMRHPNILEIFDLCYSDERAYLTMEYMDSSDLLHVILRMRERGLRIPYGVAVYAICEAAKGLHYAHELCDEQGAPLCLVHRDISPENILLGWNGGIKIGDFGIAKTNQMPDITPPETIKGKFGYMSPEQAWGDKIDRRSDIFSLAVVLYELTVGYSFYGQDAVSDMLMAARIAQYTPPSEYDPAYPKDLESILAKALDLDKKLRYQTAEEFREALEACARGNGWDCSSDAWLQWFHQTMETPPPELSLMRAVDIPKDPNSIVGHKQRPVSPITQISEDSEQTIRVSPQEIMEQLSSGQIPHSGTLPALHQSLITACIDPDHDFEAPKSEEPQPPKTSLILPKVPPSVTPTITDLQRKNTNKNRIIMALSIVVFLFILYIIIFWYCSRL